MTKIYGEFNDSYVWARANLMGLSTATLRRIYCRARFICVDSSEPAQREAFDRWCLDRAERVYEGSGLTTAQRMAHLALCQVVIQKTVKTYCPPTEQGGQLDGEWYSDQSPGIRVATEVFAAA